MGIASGTLLQSRFWKIKYFVGVKLTSHTMKCGGKCAKKLRHETNELENQFGFMLEDKQWKLYIILGHW